ncbi:MAG: iron-sulfur cluster assembly scaffold protein [Deltaproteobacteria bacterium]|nr:MAG: iron-sulfur cluster assembly scaffold protein [Deltaproteobacteria bacterium]
MNEKVKEYFQKQTNLEIMTDATVLGKGGDPGCGDYIELYLKIENDKILKATAMVAGCPYAIATTSVFTEMITNKLLDDAMLITGDQVANYLGGLPEEKIHCSLMGPDALHNAAHNYIMARICTPAGGQV